MQRIEAACPSCGARELQLFYAVDGVTVNSCLVVESRDEGRAFPKGDLRIAFCEECGLISNVAFDLLRLTYDKSYEETQTFSPAFRRFEDALIERLVDDHGLRGKTAIDIGCGKGTFLARMAEIGGVYGIGIDPSSVQERMTGIAADRVRFINEYYGERHASIDADFIACRHALEHIPDVDKMLRTVRDAVGARPIPIFFELPESLRILREAAYWDIYFEHCNYFTPGSLARAFERADFDVTDVRVGYDDQYLMLEALTTARPAPAYSRGLDQPEDVAREVAAFERSIARKVGVWREYISDAHRRGKSLAIWGSGSKCVSFLSTIGIDEEIAFVTDVNPYRHGGFIVGTGKEIVPPSRFTKDCPDEVIVMNPIYENEVRGMLESLGVVTHVITAESPLEALV
jgi:SAM-dependent methyltransferase